MGGDEMIDFQEDRMDELIEGFLKEFKEEWECYCAEMFQKAIEEWESHRE